MDAAAVSIHDAPIQVRTAAWLLEHLRVATAPVWYAPPQPADPYNLREPIDIVQLRARDAALDRLRVYLAGECYDATPAQPTPAQRIPFPEPGTEKPSDRDRHDYDDHDPQGPP